MSSDAITLWITVGGAFGGALVGTGSLGFWLATRFNNVYKSLARHELEDERRFGELKLSIASVAVQAQAATITRPHK